MHPKIKSIPSKKLIGKRISMSLSENKTVELWRSFMPRRKEITTAIGTDLYSVQVYDPALNFNDFNFTTTFEKWAAIEVTSFEKIPEGMESFTLPCGEYAVFLYKGNPNEFESTFRYIFYEWLPASEYILDSRPHFEILGEKYKNNDPASEEEIWVPVRCK